VNFPSRPRPRERVEYVVTWDGTRAARDAGAAAPVAPPTPERTPPPPPRGALARYDVLAVLRQAADGLTMRGIADALETTVPRVNALLYGLIQDGHVVAEETATKKRYGGQLRRYRVVTSPILDIGRARGAHARGDVTRPTPQTRGAKRPGRRSAPRASHATRASDRTE
jgi:hypothetical protein